MYEWSSAMQPIVQIHLPIGIQINIDLHPEINQAHIQAGMIPFSGEPLLRG